MRRDDTLQVGTMNRIGKHCERLPGKIRGLFGVLLPSEKGYMEGGRRPKSRELICMLKMVEVTRQQKTQFMVKEGTMSDIALGLRAVVVL